MSISLRKFARTHASNFKDDNVQKSIENSEVFNAFLFELQDLNLRPLAPQGRLEHFSGHFVFFQTFPLRQK